MAHFRGQFGWFFAISMIPLVEDFGMEFTIPIWTAVVASIFLGERLSFGRVMAIAFGFCGILVILRPGLTIISLGSIAALAAAFGYATAHTATRFLAQRDTPLCILFFMALMQAPIAFFPSLYDWKWPTAEDWPWILLVGLTAMSAHYTLTRAFELAEATVVVPMEFLRLPVITGIGYAFYDESIEFWVGIGAVLICTGIIFNLRGASRG